MRSRLKNLVILNTYKRYAKTCIEKYEIFCADMRNPLRKTRVRVFFHIVQDDKVIEWIFGGLLHNDGLLFPQDRL